MLKQSHARVAEIYPEVADTVHVTVLPVVRPALDPLGGVTGRYFDSSTKERKLPPKTVDPQVHARILAAIEAAAPTPHRNHRS